jgi:hypothetical protein
MKAFDQPTQLVDAIKEAKAHTFSRVIFWPRSWKTFASPKQIKWKWKSVPFAEASASRVPDDKHGLYSFVLCPNVADHPKNHFILYIGKADNMTLRNRFTSYFQEMKRIKRPAICYHLNQYAGFLEFCYTPVSNKCEIERGEDSLLAALMPPCNTYFPGEVSQIIGGLR